LEISTESATELDVFEAVYGVVEETSQGDDANSKTSRLHSTYLDNGNDDRKNNRTMIFCRPVRKRRGSAFHFLCSREAETLPAACCCMILQPLGGLPREAPVQLLKLYRPFNMFPG
jgi:hypothetical protein